MKLVPELSFGFRDAENYKRKENKQLFDKFFLRTLSLDKLCDPSTFFLIGEKGTGKTAYAVYLTNSAYKDNMSVLRYIRETEYEKFLLLKKNRNLNLTDFTNIWKVIIYLLISQQISQNEKKNPFFGHFFKFLNLKKAIDDYYKQAFTPEIINAIQFAEDSKIAAELISKYSQKDGEETILSFSENQFQINLLYIQKQFEEALSSLKLNRNHILFIDGIDIRPSFIPYDVYIDCIKGLANAVWMVNNDFFSGIKDSPGRLRVVLLVRPDIFNSLNLHNRNSKVRDNSVILNWITTYLEYKYSDIFHMADKILSNQQDKELEFGQAWAHYFPYNPKNEKQLSFPSSFVKFLRFSLYRPRDILTILSIQKENFIEQRRKPSEVFSEDDFDHPSFTRKYSDYLLGEVKDHLSFYYSDNDYELFIKFFHYLEGRSRFNYEEFEKAFSNYKLFLDKNNSYIPAFCETSDYFLQFLYDLNIICFTSDTEDGKLHFGWCYRERSPSNIAPKIKTHVRYEVHYGLMKALDLGKRFIRK